MNYVLLNSDGVLHEVQRGCKGVTWCGIMIAWTVERLKSPKGIICRNCVRVKTKGLVLGLNTISNADYEKEDC